MFAFPSLSLSLNMSPVAVLLLFFLGSRGGMVSWGRSLTKRGCFEVVLKISWSIARRQHTVDGLMDRSCASKTFAGSGITIFQPKGPHKVHAVTEVLTNGGKEK